MTSRLHDQSAAQCKNGLYVKRAGYAPACRHFHNINKSHNIHQQKTLNLILNPNPNPNDRFYQVKLENYGINSAKTGRLV